MKKLKLLHLNYVKLNGSYEEFPKSLVWLSWLEFPLASIPTTFCLEKLVALDMQASKLKHNWKAGKFLGELKILNLSHCHNIVKTPCFSGLPILEKLKLKYCVNLIEIDDAIVDLQRLVFLNLEGCQNLRKLSRKIGLLRCLEVLILSGCSRFDELPMELGKMESLRVLLADGTAINQSKCDTQSWHSIISSWVFPQRSTQSLSFSLAFLPRSLKILSLANCNLSDDAIPNDLSCLPFLQRINLRGNRFHRLPESINSLSSLYYLCVDGCRELQSLPELPMSLRIVNASYCTSLTRVTNLSNRSKEFKLDFFGCEKLIEVQGLFKLEPVRNTDKDFINKLGLFNLESIENIEVEMYNTFTFEKRKAPLQVLHECGVSSIFVPGSEVPSWLNHHSNGSSISFGVPPLIGQNISGLNLCIVYRHKYKLYPKITIETKSIKWSYTPSSLGIPGATEDILWLSHWKFGDNFEVGEQVNVSVNIDCFEVVEFGIHLYYEPSTLLGNQANGEEIVQTSSWHQTQTKWGATNYFNRFFRENY